MSSRESRGLPNNVVILGELARSALVFAGNYSVMTHFAAAGLRFDLRPDFNVLAVITGLITGDLLAWTRGGTSAERVPGRDLEPLLRE